MGRNYKKWTSTDIHFILDNQNMLDKDVADKLRTKLREILEENNLNLD